MRIQEENIHGWARNHLIMRIRIFGPNRENRVNLRNWKNRGRARRNNMEKHLISGPEHLIIGWLPNRDPRPRLGRLPKTEKIEKMDGAGGNHIGRAIKIGVLQLNGGGWPKSGLGFFSLMSFSFLYVCVLFFAALLFFWGNRSSKHRGSEEPLCFSGRSTLFNRVGAIAPRLWCSFVSSVSIPGEAHVECGETMGSQRTPSVSPHER